MTVPAKDPHGGEACRYCGDQANCVAPGGAKNCLHAKLAPAARPAVDRAEPPEGLREAIRECLDDEVLTRTGRSVGDIASGHVADAILALPAVAALLAKLVAVEAFRRWYVDSGHADAEVLDRLRRALGGPS